MAWIGPSDCTLEVPTDREVKSTIVHRLRENLYTQGSRIRVSFSEGVVELDGQVETPAAREAAADDAWMVPGVFEVRNGLVVGRAA